MHHPIPHAVNSENGISLLGLLLEAIELLLMIAAAGGITLMFGRMHRDQPRDSGGDAGAGFHVPIRCCGQDRRWEHHLD